MKPCRSRRTPPVATHLRFAVRPWPLEFMPWTLPNLLTLSRIAAIPFVAAAFYVPPPLGPWLVLLLFAAASVTDFLDGWLARRSGCATPFGQFLDPVADKLLVAAVLVLLAVDGRAPTLAVAIILCREILVSALREEMARHGVRVTVSRLAKVKTACQMSALALLLAAGVAGSIGMPPAQVANIGAALLWLAAVLSVVTAAGYFRPALVRLARGEAPPP